MYIAVFAGKYILGGPIDFFRGKGLYQQAVSIDKDQGMLCRCEQGIRELTDPVGGDLCDERIPPFYKHRFFDFYFRRAICTCTDAGRTFYLGFPFIVAGFYKKDALVICSRQDGVGIVLIIPGNCRRRACIGAWSPGWSEKVFTLLEDDEQAVVEIGMGRPVSIAPFSGSRGSGTVIRGVK